MAERGERRQASRCCQGRGGAWAEPFSVPGKRDLAPCISAASSSPASPCLPLPFALSDCERLVCPCRVCGQVKGPGWRVQGLKGPRDHVQSPHQNSRVQSSPWLWPPCSVTSRGRSLGLPGCRLWTALAVQPQYGPQSSCP